MEKREVLDRILTTGLIPVVRVSTSKEALAVADALRAGGVGIIEITMTVRGALDVINELDTRYTKEIIVGAGTVLDPETGRAALLAGAQFLVSPTTDLELIRLAHRYGVVVMPGAMTPTEILAAWTAGADLVKVFPAGRLGGPDYIRSIKEPFPQILLVPTGGVKLENTGAFIRAGASAVGAAGALVDKTAVAKGAFDVIREKAAAFLDAIRSGRESG
jgi:2-dehydro-3-deoxyphosphogluconate aldolase / (4S)-4-hydroxy-2-oxoglutarate aldolase